MFCARLGVVNTSSEKEGYSFCPRAARLSRACFSLLYNSFFSLPLLCCERGLTPGNHVSEALLPIGSLLGLGSRRFRQKIEVGRPAAACFGSSPNSRACPFCPPHLSPAEPPPVLTGPTGSPSSQAAYQLSVWEGGQYRRN